MLATQSPDSAHLHQLLEQKAYFKLKKSFLKEQSNLSVIDRHYYSAFIEHTFYQSQASNEAIDVLMTDHQQELTKDQWAKVYQIKLANHINLYEYAAAATVTKLLLKDFSTVLSEEERIEIQNVLGLWETLKDVPKQQTHKTQDSTIPITRDKANLQNIPVQFEEETLHFVFDTGANISVIQRSIAEQIGLEILEANFYVTAFTGVKVASNLAIARKLKIGHIEYQNVVFLVFDDKHLSFPQANYSISGIIGFPVIDAMEELHLGTTSLSVPHKATPYDLANFATEGLTPLVAVKYHDDELRFSFDTGAARTILFPNFYKQYQDDITAKYQKKMVRHGSAGGKVESEVYDKVEAELHIGNSHAVLENLHVQLEEQIDHAKYLYGNLGQDYIQQFDKVILSFKYASLLFE